MKSCVHILCVILLVTLPAAPLAVTNTVAWEVTTTAPTTTTTWVWDCISTTPPRTTTTTLNLTGPNGMDPNRTTLPPTTTTGYTTSTQPTGIVTTTQNPTVGDVILPGDMDGDGHLDMADALLLFIVCSGQPLDTPVDVFFRDYNGDGIVNMMDCLLLFGYVSGN